MSVIVSAFPVGFCPNNENISWGCLDGDQLQVSFMEGTAINFKIYEYWDGDGWADPNTGDILDPDFAINTPGKGFSYITADPENVSFTEVSPLAD